MAHNIMTSSEEESGWNSALKSDNEQHALGTDSDGLVLDSKVQEIEPSPLPAHDPSPAGAMEAPTDLSIPQTDVYANLQEQPAPNEPNWNHTSDPVAESSADARPEESVEVTETTLDGHDDPAFQQVTAAKPIETTTQTDVTSDEAEVKEPSSQSPERPIFNTDKGDKVQTPDPTTGGNSWKDDHSGDHEVPAGGEHNNSDHGFWDEKPGGDADEEEEEEDFFSQLKTQTKPIYVPPETESRFDEGLPLLDDKPETLVEPTTKAESQIERIFDDEDDEGAGFFSEVQKSAAMQEPPSHLTRKSTSEVIDSVGGAQDSPISETLPTPQQSDFLSPDPTSQKEVKNIPSEEDLAARWQAALDDDDDDLLLEDEIGGDATADQQPAFQNTDVPVNNATGLSSPFETPQSSARAPPQPTAFAPHQPSTTELLQGVSSPSYFAPTPPKLSSSADRTESFAERSKEGYKSPYDIPMDLTRPRRPVASQKPVVVQPGNAAAPPRSSSIPPPLAAAMSTSAPPPAASVPPPKNFYEELPPAPPKPRPASAGRYTPGPNVAVAGHPSQVPPPPPANPFASIPPVPQGSTESYVEQPQLQEPERLEPYANTLAPNPPSVPSAASRYSPKPPGLQAGTKPPPSPRYSPAPPPTSAPPPRNRYASQPPAAPAHGAPLPFQPRTSSPLAYHEKVSYQPKQVEEHPQLVPAVGASPPSRQSVDHGLQGTFLSGPAGDSPSAQGTVHENAPPLMNEQHASPPRNPYAPPAYVNQFSQRLPAASGPSTLPVAPPQNAARAGDSQFAPPRRSQTQSPSRQQIVGPSLSMQSTEPFQRPASAHDTSSPIKEATPYAPSQVSARNRAASQHIHFIPPSDEQQLDPLQRWKGAPIVSFGFGGVITSCFPKHIPRYVAGQAAPLIKSSPGEVKICQINDWIPAAESIVQHPGPLKAKSKKKELLAWLSSKIAAFENEGLSEVDQLHPDSHKRHDEKVLLWKIVRIMVENDGVLNGSDNVHTSLRGVIFPNLQYAESFQTYGDGFTSASTLYPSGSSSQPDAVNPQLMESLRNDLVVGDRQKAIWSAVDNRLWGHAMVLASTLDKSVWKQVVQEFVRREVKATTGNTESLAALYEIFAGNIEESIDELVPPSARAGLQMVSKVNGSGPTKNALDGLDSWRDTLGLVLSNRSPDDHNALLALGRLLSSYGRTEAAHICYIFSRVAVFSGPDDPQANIVLLGADHQRCPSTFFQDQDAILLTEAYEYAISVLSGTPMAAFPHLLGFKLVYAHSLADGGRKSDALQYCDSVAAALRATTRPSSYHHQQLFSEVGDLSARLRQTTNDGGSWISRPSMEKVSGSMWARFNSFVSGEDSDAASTGSGKAGDADIGPFAKISGTPTVSRSPSVSDFYGSYPGSGMQGMPSSAPSRYHPVNQYAPNSSPEQLRGRSSLDSQRSTGMGFGFGQRRNSQEVSTPIDSGMYHGGPFYNSPSAVGYQSTPPQPSHMPLAPVEEDMASPIHADATYASMQGSSADGMSYQPPVNPADSFGGPLHDQSSTAMPGTADTGYMPPPSTGGYEPPVNDAVVISTPGSKGDLAEDASYTNRSAMEDDDSDIAARAAAVQKEEKQRKDREADEAFRKAAEEDGKLLPRCQFVCKSLITCRYSQETRTTEEIMVLWVVWR